MAHAADVLRVIVADDEALARRMLTTLLGRERDVAVVAECSNGPATIEAVRTHAPDVLFLDVRMPGASGIEVLERLGADAVRAVVLVTAFEAYAISAFDHHALDYVLKPVDADRFRTTMQRVRERLREQRSAAIADETLRALARAYGSPMGRRASPILRVWWSSRPARRPWWSCRASTGSKRTGTTSSCTRARRCIWCAAR